MWVVSVKLIVNQVQNHEFVLVGKKNLTFLECRKNENGDVEIMHIKKREYESLKVET